MSERSRCKNMCRAEFKGDSALLKRCKSACKTSAPPQSGIDFMRRFNTLGQYYKPEVSIISGGESDDLEWLDNGNGGLSNSEASEDFEINPLLIVAVVVVLILVYMNFIKKA